METDAGWDRKAWRGLNQALGLTAVHIPEEHGGQGFGFGELGIVLEEEGARCSARPCSPPRSPPARSSTQAPRPRRRRCCPASPPATRWRRSRWPSRTGRWDAAGTALTATEAGGTWRLDGRKGFVLDGHTADLIVVLARALGSAGEEGLCFFTVAGDAPGLTRRALKVMDPTRKLARLDFAGVEATPLGRAGRRGGPARPHHAAGRRLPRQRDGRRCRAAARGCAGLRQAAHAIRPADRLLPVDEAQMRRHAGGCRAGKAAAYYAAAALDEGDEDLPGIVALAKAAASDAYIQTAIHAVQIHGGIGFTWENDTHLWFKRAKSSEVLFGDAHQHREAMMRHYASAAA